MSALRSVSIMFLLVVITVASVRFGYLFLTHQWDAAAGWAGLMFGSNTVALLIWAWREPPRAQRPDTAPNRHVLKRPGRVA